MAGHVLYTKDDFTPEQIERENIIAKHVFNGIDICKRCGACERELDEYATCEDFRKYLRRTDTRGPAAPPPLGPRSEVVTEVPKQVQYPTIGPPDPYSAKRTMQAKAASHLGRGDPVTIVSHGDQGPTVDSARRKVIEDVYRRGGPGAGASKYRK